MKARDLKLDTVLHLNPREGRIFLHRRRVVVVNADALGALRKDLILNLGPERAKGFLVRYGWSCGYHDALDMQDRYPWDDETEWLQAAPYLHSLEGVARVRVERSEIDRQEGRFHVEGTWSHSYEAEQHLKQFGLAPAPVCWTLCGYAGGYGTAFMGRRILYKEVACVGAGDPVCRFVGKALEGWGAEIESELPFYEESKVAEELDRAYREIRLRHQQLQRTAAVHEELTRLVLEGKGIEEITSALHRLLGCPVAVEDANHRLLAVVPPDAMAPREPERTGPVGLAGDSREQAVRVASLKAGRRALRLGPVPAAGIGGDWLAAPIVAGPRVLGYVCTLCLPEPPEEQAAVLERAATVYAVEMLKQQAVAAAEARILGDVVASLLRGDFSDDEAMARRMANAGIDLGPAHRVVVADWGVAPERLGPDILVRLQQTLRAVAGGGLAVTHGDAVALLVPAAPAGAGDEGGWLQHVWQRLCRSVEGGAGARAAAGLPCQRPREFSASYRLARETLEILREFGATGLLVTCDELGPYRHLLRSEVRGPMASWARQFLEPLLAYDARRGSQLVQTLRTYLRCQCSLAETARVSRLHPSGLKYRLSRIEQLLGVDLSSMEVRFRLHLALLILRLAGEGA